MNKKNIKSTTGTIHKVIADDDFEYVFCGSTGSSFSRSFGIVPKNWKHTKENITCKVCLRILSEKNEEKEMWPDLDFSGFEKLHTSDDGKYKIGEMVKYIGPKDYKYYPGSWENAFLMKFFKVRAVNKVDEDTVEYLLDEFPYLVYEEELKK